MIPRGRAVLFRRKALARFGYLLSSTPASRRGLVTYDYGYIWQKTKRGNCFAGGYRISVYKGPHQDHLIPQTASDTLDASHLPNQHLSKRSSNARRKFAIQRGISFSWFPLNRIGVDVTRVAVELSRPVRNTEIAHRSCRVIGVW